MEDLHKIAAYFHNRNIKIVIMSGIKFPKDDKLSVFASDGEASYLLKTPEYHSDIAISGTGDE